MAVSLVLFALASAAAAADLAGDADAAKVEELIRKDDWPGAQAIWLRRGADALSDVGNRWHALDSHDFRADGPKWTEDSGRARAVARLAAILDLDRLAEDACRIACDKAPERERRDAAWLTALTLTRLGRPGDAAPYFRDGIARDKSGHGSVGAESLVRLSARLATPEGTVEDRIVLGGALVYWDGNNTFTARSGSSLLRWTIEALPAAERTPALCEAAVLAALFAHDASDLRVALDAWKASGAGDAAGVARAVTNWACHGGSEPFTGVVAAIAADTPIRPRPAVSLAREAERFDPAAAENLLRKAAAHGIDPDEDLMDTDTDSRRDAIAAIDARRTMALLCMRRRQFEEAISFWRGVRAYGGCGNCMGGQLGERDRGIDECRVGLGKAAEVLRGSRELGALDAGYADWMWTPVHAAGVAGCLDEWVASVSKSWPFDRMKDEFADALTMERMRLAGDPSLLVAELVSANPLNEMALTPGDRSFCLGQADDQRNDWRREKALELLRDLGGREVPPLTSRFAELPVLRKKTEVGVSSQRAGIVAALANSRAPEADAVLAAWHAKALAGEDVGVSAAALAKARELRRNDLLWVR